MREQKQRVPILVGELALSFRHRRAHVDRPVTRKDAFPEKVVRFLIDRKLEVAKREAAGDPLLERLRQVIDQPHLDDALDLLARNEPQPDGRDDAEQPIAANRQTKQFGIFAAAARAGNSTCIDQHERFDVGDERLHLEAAAVHVSCKRPADRQPIRAGLLLRNAPLVRPAFLCLQQVFDERRPHDAGLDFDESLHAIERPHTIEPGHVDERRAIGKLLSAHSVAAARDADELSCRVSVAKHALEV